MGQIFLLYEKGSLGLGTGILDIALRAWVRDRFLRESRAPCGSLKNPYFTRARNAIEAKTVEISSLYPHFPASNDAPVQ